MSSIAEKSNLLREKRSFFMRSGSFEKLKCSAKYPFRVVGVKLSKASVIELVESIIAKSRLLSQRLLLVLFIIIYKTICSTLSILVHTSANPLSVVGVCDKQNKNTTLGFYERLQIKVEKLQRHKKRLDSDKSSDEICNQITQPTTPIQPPKIIKIEQKQLPAVPSLPILSSIFLENKNIFDDNNKIDSKEYEFHAEIKRLRKYSEEREIQCLGNQKIPKLSDLKSNKNLIEIICLYPLVYGSILIMLCQIYILGSVLTTAPITFGYIFLIGSLGIVAVITYKVFLLETIRKVKTTPNKRKSNELRITNEQKIITTNHNNNNDNVISSTVEESTSTEEKRQSRSRLKRNIDLSSKTLSKIKLL